jgi:peroxiredoxin
MTQAPFYPGDAIAWFTCRSNKNPRFQFETVGGNYIVLSFLISASRPESAAIWQHINGPLRKFFDDKNALFFAVTTDSTDETEQRLADSIPGIRCFWDTDSAVHQLYKIGQYPVTFVIDPNLRVIAVIPGNTADGHNHMLGELLQRLPPSDMHAGVPSHAPVLIVPRVFERDFCRELIGLYTTHGGKPSGFMRERDGKTIGVLDASFKRRKDFMFEEQPEYEKLRQAIRARLTRRLLPEIKKAYQYSVTRIERYLVASYTDEDQGFFNRHRDNTTKGTAHRRFACTLNLNAEDYEGGELRFPEHGMRTYRAPTGGAVIFSCSLMHEATPVTRGARYAFLPFLYDEEAARIRVENRQYIDTSEHDAKARGETN